MTAKLIEEKAYDIRYTSISDESFLKTWLLDEETSKWLPPSSKLDLENFARNWVGFSRFKCSLTAIYDKNPVGIATIFLMPYLKVAHLCMIYIVVDPEFRNKGIGTSMLKNIEHLAKTNFPRIESIHLEIYEGCPIIPILQKAGYEEVFKQDKFVKFGNDFKARIVYEKQIR
jgi:GNAT superfamily N-acetyltransferase